MSEEICSLQTEAATAGNSKKRKKLQMNSKITTITVLLFLIYPGYVITGITN
jgi:hypothetical protein